MGAEDMLAAETQPFAIERTFHPSSYNEDTARRLAASEERCQAAERDLELLQDLVRRATVDFSPDRGTWELCDMTDLGEDDVDAVARALDS